MIRILINKDHYYIQYYYMNAGPHAFERTCKQINEHL